MFGRIIQSIDKASLYETELKSTELSRKKPENINGVWRWY